MALTATEIKSTMRRYRDRLRTHQDDLNRLNVYPVPDGDTGTNMAATVDCVMEELATAESMGEIANAIAHGSLMGGSGNSGVILAQILRAFSDVFRLTEAVDVRHLVEALDRGSVAAYKAVGDPVEGTILTVLREAAEAAGETVDPVGQDLAAFLTNVYLRARESLERTPELLPVLKDAGVVDAGGAGFLLLLAAFLEEVSGEEVSLPARIFKAAAVQMAASPGGPGSSYEVISGLRYEVMFFLDTPDESVDGFKRAWQEIGGSIVIVGGDGTYNCHIHTDDIGNAIEAGIAVGRPFRIKITDLADQADEVAHEVPFEPRPEFADAAVGVVAVAAGPGVVEMFRSLGAQGMVTGGQTMNPSLADLLAVVDRVEAGTVLLLPNNKNIIPVARQADAESSKTVIVVPTRSVPQGLATMVAYRADGDDGAPIVAAMEKAAADICTGELTRAVRDATTPAGSVVAGDWLGLVDGKVTIVDAHGRSAVTRLLEQLVTADSELVTMVKGAEADVGLLAAAERWLADNAPNAELETVEGGQPLYPYLISVE